MSLLKFLFDKVFRLFQSRIWLLISFLCIQVILLQIWSIPLWFVGLSALVIILILFNESVQTHFTPPTKSEPILTQSNIEANIQAILDSIPDSSFLVDQNGIVLYLNRIAKVQFDLVQIGDSLTLFFRIPVFVDAFNRVSSSERMESVSWTKEVPIETVLEANISPLNLDSIPTNNDESNMRLYLVIVHDLTELHRIERMRADFVANASHELRTPLSSISGFIETLQGSAKSDPESQKKFLTIMLEQTRRMSRLIDDLLSLSRIEVKSQVNRDVRTDLVVCVKHVLATLSPLAKKKSVKIEYLSQIDSAIINGEFDEIVQVIENLTNNALEYGSSGGLIEIELKSDYFESEHPNWYLSVRDFGQGIESLQIPRLTERFYRVENSNNSEIKGTGLGLAIVKHVLNRHRGRLMIESELGKGAKFTLILPILKDV